MDTIQFPMDTSEGSRSTIEPHQLLGQTSASLEVHMELENMEFGGMDGQDMQVHGQTDSNDDMEAFMRDAGNHSELLFGSPPIVGAPDVVVSLLESEDKVMDEMLADAMTCPPINGGTQLIISVDAVAPPACPPASGQLVPPAAPVAGVEADTLPPGTSVQPVITAEVMSETASLPPLILTDEGHAAGTNLEAPPCKPVRTEGQEAPPCTPLDQGVSGASLNPLSPSSGGGGSKTKSGSTTSAAPVKLVATPSAHSKPSPLAPKAAPGPANLAPGQRTHAPQPPNPPPPLSLPQVPQWCYSRMQAPPMWQPGGGPPLPGNFRPPLFIPPMSNSPPPGPPHSGPYPGYQLRPPTPYPIPPPMFWSGPPGGAGQPAPPFPHRPGGGPGMPWGTSLPPPPAPTAASGAENQGTSGATGSSQAQTLASTLKAQAKEGTVSEDHAPAAPPAFGKEPVLSAPPLMEWTGTAAMAPPLAPMEAPPVVPPISAALKPLSPLGLGEAQAKKTKSEIRQLAKDKELAKRLASASTGIERERAAMEMLYADAPGTEKAIAIPAAAAAIYAVKTSTLTTALAVIHELEKKSNAKKKERQKEKEREKEKEKERGKEKDKDAEKKEEDHEDGAAEGEEKVVVKEEGEEVKVVGGKKRAEKARNLALLETADWAVQQAQIAAVEAHMAAAQANDLAKSPLPNPAGSPITWESIREEARGRSKQDKSVEAVVAQAAAHALAATAAAAAAKAAAHAALVARQNAVVMLTHRGKIRGLPPGTGGLPGGEPSPRGPPVLDHASMAASMHAGLPHFLRFPMPPGLLAPPLLGLGAQLAAADSSDKEPESSEEKPVRRSKERKREDKEEIDKGEAEKKEAAAVLMAAAGGVLEKTAERGKGKKVVRARRNQKTAVARVADSMDVVNVVRSARQGAKKKDVKDVVAAESRSDSDTVSSKDEITIDDTAESNRDEDEGGSASRGRTGKQKGATAGEVAKYEPPDVEVGMAVEVCTDAAGLRDCWFPGRVMKREGMKVLVRYDEPVPEGEEPEEEWVGLYEMVEARVRDVSGRWVKGGGSGGRVSKRPMLRLSPGDTLGDAKKERRRRAPRLGPHTWQVGDHADCFTKDGWWECVVCDISDIDNTRITVIFPEDGDTEVTRPWNLRLSHEWKDGIWVQWKRSESPKGEDATGGKRKLKSPREAAISKKEARGTMEERIPTPVLTPRGEGEKGEKRWRKGVDADELRGWKGGRAGKRAKLEEGDQGEGGGRAQTKEKVKDTKESDSLMYSTEDLREMMRRIDRGQVAGGSNGLKASGSRTEVEGASKRKHAAELEKGKQQLGPDDSYAHSETEESEQEDDDVEEIVKKGRDKAKNRLKKKKLEEVSPKLKLGVKKGDGIAKKKDLSQKQNLNGKKNQRGIAARSSPAGPEPESPTALHRTRKMGEVLLSMKTRKQ